MSWGAVAGAAIGVVGGALQSKSSNDAGQIQSDAGLKASENTLAATKDSNQLMADIFKQGVISTTPYAQGGQLALSAIMSGLGLGPAQAALTNNRGNSATTGGGPAAPEVPTYTTADGRIVDGNGQPVNTPAGPTDYGISNLSVGANQSQLDGAAAGTAGTFLETFKPSDLTLDPSYQFRLDEGTRNLRAAQAAGGNRWGGQAMKDITNYSQGAASQEFSNANSRFMENKRVLFDRLMGVANNGQNVITGNQTAGNNTAANIGSNTMKGTEASNNYLTGAAASEAAGKVGSTNGIVNGINSGLNNWMAMSYLNPRSAPGGNTQPTQYAGNMTGFYGGNGTSGD